MTKRKLIKVIVSVVVLALSAGYLLYAAMESSFVYYYSVDEFAAAGFIGAGGSEKGGDRPFVGNRTVRLAGRVKAESIKSDIGKGKLEFVLAGENSSLAVKYHGQVPRNFTEDKEVIVEGVMATDGIFEADRIITRCESKYSAKLQQAPKTKNSSAGAGKTDE